MTQQNAALVEESAAAASALSDQARKLGEVVSLFRVSGGSYTPAATALSTSKPLKPAARSVPTAPAAGAARPLSKPATAAASTPVAVKTEPSAVTVPPAKAPVKTPAAPAPAPVRSSPKAAVVDDQDWETF